jgi:hypothetical protein
VPGCRAMKAATSSRSRSRTGPECLPRSQPVDGEKRYLAGIDRPAGASGGSAEAGPQTVILVTHATTESNVRAAVDGIKARATFRERQVSRANPGKSRRKVIRIERAPTRSREKPFRPKARVSSLHSRLDAIEPVSRNVCVRTRSNGVGSSKNRFKLAPKTCAAPLIRGRLPARAPTGCPGKHAL